jgi:hypothetical protein
MLACSMLFFLILQLQGSSNQSAAPASSTNTPTQSPSTSEQQGTAADSKPDPQSQSPEGRSVPLAEAPIPATSGTPGLFTVQTAEALPKGVFTFSGYTNRYGLAPGSVTALVTGLSFAAGVTKKLTLFAQFEPYIHLHVGQPSQLSFGQPPGCSHNVYMAPIFCGVNGGPEGFNSWHGPAAAYVQDFPYAASNVSDWGPAALGGKYNFYSETRGDPLSVSLGGAVIFPTESAAAELAKHGAQTGAFNYSITLGLSKTLWRDVLLANNVTYLITTNPRVGNETLYTPGDVMIFGQGFVFRSQSRLQFLTEYTCVFEQEGHAFGLVGINTESESYGPQDPIDGVWGARWYFADSAALDVGYRYMLNLHQLNDRSGFNIKISKVFGWRKETGRQKPGLETLPAAK